MGLATLRGEMIAWIIGLDLILEYALAAVAVWPLAGSSYVVKVFANDLGWNIPGIRFPRPMGLDAPSTHGRRNRCRP